MLFCQCVCFFFFQAEDGIRDLVRSRGLGDVYKRQLFWWELRSAEIGVSVIYLRINDADPNYSEVHIGTCLLYTSDAADERSSVDLGGRRIIKKKKNVKKRSVNRTRKHTEQNATNRRTHDTEQKKKTQIQK